MKQYEHDWTVVAAATVAAAVVGTLGMQTPRTFLAYGASAAAAGLVAGLFVAVEDYAGSEGAFAAVVGGLAGAVVGHPSLLGVGEVAAEAVGTTRVLLGMVGFPALALVGFLVARTVTGIRHRLAPDHTEMELDDLSGF